MERVVIAQVVTAPDFSAHRADCVRSLALEGSGDRGFGVPEGPQPMAHRGEGFAPLGGELQGEVLSGAKDSRSIQIQLLTMEMCMAAKLSTLTWGRVNRSKACSQPR